MKIDDSEDPTPLQKRSTLEAFDREVAEQTADEPPPELGRDSEDRDGEEFARLKERVRSGLYRPDMKALADQIMSDPETIDMLLEE